MAEIFNVKQSNIITYARFTHFQNIPMIPCIYCNIHHMYEKQICEKFSLQKHILWFLKMSH